MSLSPLVIETLVRVLWSAKRLVEGHEIEDCLPIILPGRPYPAKLETMLFTAHLIATSVNAGRAYLSSNPLAINYPEWAAFTKYAIRHVDWALVGKESERLDYVQRQLDSDWAEINGKLAQWWSASSAEQLAPVQLGT